MSQQGEKRKPADAAVGSEWTRRDFLARSGGLAFGGAMFLSAAELLAACGNAVTNHPSQQNVTPVKGGNIIEGNSSDIVAGFNPIVNAGALDIQQSNMIFEGLLATNPAGDLLPALAESLPKISSDGLTFTFTLRKNLKWSDGHPLTSDDVLFTYNLMFDPVYRAVRSPYRADFESFVASVSAPDPYTFMVKLKQAYAPFLDSHGLHGVLPKHVLGNLSAAEINTTSFNPAPSVASGVFKFVEWVKGDHIKLVRNDNYWRGPSYLDGYVWKAYADATGVVNGLKNGEVDVGKVTSPSFVADLQTNPDLVVYQFPVPTILAFWYNVDPNKPSGKILAEKAVRQALYMVIDRGGIVDAIYAKVGGAVATSAMPSTSWAYNKDTKPTYTIDKTKATSLLDSAGWKVGSDGVRSKDGVRMKLEVLTSAASKEYTAVAQVMQQAWKEIGLDVSVRGVPFPTELNAANTTRAFDTLVVGYQLGLDPDLSPWFHSRNIVAGGGNYSSYKNPQVDAILDQATATNDQAKRKQLYAQIQNTLADELPLGPLLVQNGFVAYHKKVHNFTAAQLANNTFYGFGTRWWMKDVFVTK
jgi:peptide/nickel transport system substrate-binding protein